jgi:predicted nucleic acid-binding protein
LPERIILLDACVLVQSTLRDTLLRAAEEELFRPRWSPLIQEEVRRTLVRVGMTDDLRARRLLATMDRAFPDAMVRGFERRIEEMTNHPKDRHVLAAAVAVHAALIVTHNLRDFPSAALAPWGIAVQAPDGFLCDLFAESADRMTEIIRRQGAALHPPQDAEQILARLARQRASRFAALMRERLRQESTDISQP